MLRSCPACPLDHITNTIARGQATYQFLCFRTSLERHTFDSYLRGIYACRMGDLCWLWNLLRRSLRCGIGRIPRLILP